MDATAWTVMGMGLTILLAIGASHRNLQARIDKQGEQLSEQMSRLRERMAHLEGLLEGLREAISGNRVA